jgi:TRAP-type C4-dicarboxylate transport system substrate-binding protein
MIDTVYAPPLGAIALQWFAKTKYITNVPMANGIGSLVVSRRFYQDLPQDLQKLLKRTGRETGEKLIAATRRDNKESMQLLQSRGLVLVEGEEDLKSGEIKRISEQAAEQLIDDGYIPNATVRQVKEWIAEYRARPQPAAEPADAVH